jgi:carbamoyltransferase
MTSPSYTIGLATTFHDPALAIIGPGGEIVFAEATERYLQYKRAPNCEPDSAARMEALIKELGAGFYRFYGCDGALWRVFV